MKKLSKSEMKEVKGGTTYNLESYFTTAGGGGFPYAVKVCKCNIVQPFNYFLGANPEGTVAQSQTANTNCAAEPGYNDCKMWV